MIDRVTDRRDGRRAVDRLARRGTIEPEQRPVARVLQDTATHVENVVRGEVQLTIAKAREEVTSVVRASMLRAAAVVLVLIGYVMLLMALATLLDARIGRWQSLLLLSFVNLVLALVLVKFPVRTGRDS